MKLVFPTRLFDETEKPGNPVFFQNQKTGFWLPVKPIFGFEWYDFRIWSRGSRSTIETQVGSIRLEPGY